MRKTFLNGQTRYNKMVFIVVVFVFFIAFILTSIIKVTICSGDSMEPTISEGQVLLYYSAQYLKEEINRGDVIIVHSDFLEALLIKRVIAIPGDTISIVEDVVYLNGNELNEDYTKEKMSYTGTPIYHELLKEGDIYSYLNKNVILEKDEYFIMGDNRNESTDSRIIGPVLRRDIVGKILTIDL